MTDPSNLSPFAKRAFNFLRDVLMPGLTHMTQVLGSITAIHWEDQPEARVLEMAFAGQESLWGNVQQGGGGPGRGYFQFEPPTCGLVLKNSISQAMATKICQSIGIPPVQSAVYANLLTNPVKIAVPFARLDTFCDPRPLPPLNNPQAGWETYIKEWRPGKPHPELWGNIYQAAIDANHAWQA